MTSGRSHKLDVSLAEGGGIPRLLQCVEPAQDELALLDIRDLGLERPAEFTEELGGRYIHNVGRAVF